jgi:hypothetical protein
MGAASKALAGKSDGKSISEMAKSFFHNVIGVAESEFIFNSINTIPFHN